MRENLAWAAGLFEGEGSFFTKKRADRPSDQARAELAMTDRDAVDRFRDVVGFGTVNGPYQYGSNVKPYWRWSTAGFEKPQALAAMFWPWLCARRRGQIKSVLADPT